MKVKNERMNKKIALLMGIVMIATIFAAMPTGKAVTYSPSNSWNIVIANDPFAGTPVYAGQQNVVFNVSIRNGLGGNDPNEITNCNLTVLTTIVRDANGNTVTSPISNWDTDQVNDDVTIWDAGTPHTFSGFQFDVRNDATPGTYNLTMHLSFKNSTGAAHQWDGYVLFDIQNRGELGNIQPVLYAGDSFKQVYVDITVSDGPIENVYLNITRPDSDFTWSGITGSVATCWAPGTLANGFYNNQFNYRLDIASDKAPGIYTGSYTLEYTKNGIRYTETGNIDFTVDFTPLLTASISNGTVVQGTTMKTFDITFTNTGNVDLMKAKVRIDPISADPAWGAYLSGILDHYEGNDAVTGEWVGLGDLNMGGTAHAQLTVGIDTYIPAGEHKIMFDFAAYFFDNGATGNPTGYHHIGMVWQNGNPDTPLWFFDNNENSEYDGGDTAMGIDVNTNANQGTYVMITVNDYTLDFEATSTAQINMDGTIADQTVTFQIRNKEQVDFRDIVLAVNTGADSPFVNSVNSSADWSEDSNLNTLPAGSTVNVDFHISVKNTWKPGVYVIPMRITGINENTMETVSTDIDARVEVIGFGPELVVTGVTTGDIEPGKIFYLNLTVQNLGDDTARDVFVTIPGNVGYNWDVIDGFVSAISSGENNYTNRYDYHYYSSSSVYSYWRNSTYANTNSKDVAYSGITLEQLNITDAKDIVDLALYIEGVFNSPTPEIWLMKADSVAPGQSITLSFKMQTNINMVEGRPYVIQVVTDFTDSHGNGPSGNLQTQQITIRTANPGVPYHTTPTTTANAGALSNENLMLLGLVLLVILLIIVGVALAGSRGGKKKKEHEPETYEAPPEEPEEMPSEISEEPAPEEMPPEESESEEVEPGFPLEEKEGETSF